MGSLSMQFMKTLSMSSRTGRELQRYNQGCRQVVGCIPYRYKKTKQSSSVHGIDDLEFLLISSQKSPRMMFPKGGWETDESLEAAALRETFEEAGVIGEVKVQEYLGTWSFKSKSLGTFHEGHMLPLCVTEELEDWPEKTVRNRSWMKFSEAREVCWHPWMKEALDIFASKLTKRNEDVPQTCHFDESSNKEQITCAIAKPMFTEEQRINTAAAKKMFSEELRISNVANSIFSEEQRTNINAKTMFNEELGISHVPKQIFGEAKGISIVAQS